MMDAGLMGDVSCDTHNDTDDARGLLSATSYSLRDVSNGHHSLAGKDDGDLLDASVLALLEKPYSQLHDKLRLRKHDLYDGFDNSTGSTWIYPTNYPVRQYQFSITKAALFTNTLVVLPTGLGKTFIAAVVMYNIYRWYPTGKVIFMAPTRPLVNQQIEACYRVMGIPREDTAEITGRQQRKGRAELWQAKRVFYVTPQVVQADMCGAEQAFPAEQVRLVVIDEAHKAKGRYAYTEVIRLIAARNKHFRVLALSATPGRTLEDVAEVIQNLLISHVEVRWDNSIDVSPYTFRKRIRTIVIPLGATIQAVREQLLLLVDPYVRRLLNANVLSCGHLASMTRGMVIMEQKRFRENSLLRRHPNHAAVNADFGVCVSMFHALDLLVRHGIRALLNFFADVGDGAAEKYFVAKDRCIKECLDQLRQQYGAQKDQIGQPPQKGPSTLPTPADDDIDFGHPKFRVLEKQLAAHFTEQPDSKAIVFCEFRDSVAMIHRMLSQRGPLIRPKCIVGQGGTSGIRAVTQKEQIAAMKQFRSGTCNTLIATCVAEEGIDVGEVDLIVCFDITKNPTRFVQRIGRTGRQRVGRVLMLVAEGEEHETLKKVLSTKDRTNQQLAKSKDIIRILYRNSPRLVPGEFEPRCVEMFINVAQEGTEAADVNKDTRAAGKRKAEKREPDLGAAGKRRKVATLADGATPPKCTQDVRRFFQRTPRRLTNDELDASDRDVFSLCPTQQEKPHDRSSVVVDRCIRTGQTDKEAAIERRLQPLISHYEQLRRQKFLLRQQCLNVPTVEQIIQRRLFADVNSQFARQILMMSRDSAYQNSFSAATMDDPLELPQLPPLLESHRTNPTLRDDLPSSRACSPPAGGSMPCPPAVEASISNMFDSTLNLSTLNQSTPKCRMLRTLNGSGQKQIHCNDEPALPGFSNTENHAVDRPVTGESKASLTVQSGSKRNPPVSILKRAQPIDSPLLRAFNRSVTKRSNSDGATDRRAVNIQMRMVLEYFHLSTVEQIFTGDADEGIVADTAIEMTINRKLFANDRAAHAANATNGFSTAGTLLAVETHGDVAFAPSSQPILAFSAQCTGATKTQDTLLSLASPLPLEHNRQAGGGSKKEEVSPFSESRSDCGRKNFNLGSAALVLDDSDDDLFDALDSQQVRSKHRSSKHFTPAVAEIVFEHPSDMVGKTHEMQIRAEEKESNAGSKYNPNGLCEPFKSAQSYPRSDLMVNGTLHLHQMKPASSIQFSKRTQNHQYQRYPDTAVSSNEDKLEDAHEEDETRTDASQHMQHGLPDGRSMLCGTKQETTEHVALGSLEKSPSVFANFVTVTVSERCKPKKLNFSRLRRDSNQQTSRSIDQVSEQEETPVAQPSPFFLTCGTQIVHSPAGSPSRPLAEESDCKAILDQDKSIIGIRGVRRRMRYQHVFPENRDEDEVEDEAEDDNGMTGMAREMLTRLEEDELNIENDNDSDELFQTCKSDQFFTRPGRRANGAYQLCQRMPAPAIQHSRVPKTRQQTRHAARAFFHSQAAVSGSEEECEDEHECDENNEMASFLDMGGSQSPDADATCVDMRAIYLRSLRSPIVSRNAFKIPAARFSPDHSPNTRREKHSVSDIYEDDEDDNVNAVYDGRSDGARQQEEDLESSFITDVIEVDSELSELEQAELVLRERRRAAKRAREEGKPQPSTKRRRKIIVMSDSE